MTTLDAQMQDALRLKRRFEDDRKKPGRSRADFARKYEVTEPLIYQHVSGRTPISIEMALHYAEWFDVPVSQISRRCGEIIAKAKYPEFKPASSMGVEDTKFDPLLHKINEIFKALSNESRKKVIEYAQERIILDTMSQNSVKKSG